MRQLVLRRIENQPKGVMNLFKKWVVLTVLGLCIMGLPSPLYANGSDQEDSTVKDHFDTWVYENEAKIDQQGMTKANLDQASQLLGPYKSGPQKAYLAYLRGLMQLDQGHVNAGYTLMSDALNELAFKPNQDVEMIILSRQLDVARDFQQLNSITEKGFRLHRLAEQKKDTQQVIAANVALLGAYIYMGDHEKVAEIMGEIDREISKKTTAKGLEAVYMLKGDLAIMEAQNDKALENYALGYQYALKNKRYLPFVPWTTLLKTRMADANTRMGHIEEAKALINEVALSMDKSRPVEVANLYYHRALLSNVKGRTQEAIGYFEKVAELSKHIEVLSGTVSGEHAINRILADLYYEVGDFKKSAEAFRTYENTLGSEQVASQWSSAISNARTHEEESLKEKVRYAEELRINQEKLLKAQNDKLFISYALVIALVLIILLIFLNILSLKKRQKQLIHLSSTDFLTQVKNRDAMMKVMQSAESSNNILILMDVDNFKNINDQHGHLVGDEVLVRIAQTIKGSLREEDHLARYGGEEFLVFLEKTNQQDGWEIAERIRSNVENLQWGDRKIVTTLSMGMVSTFSKDVDALLKAADVLMYHAKESGKNMIFTKALLESEIRSED